MAKVQIYYKGRRKRRNYLFIPFVILLAIISVSMVAFYGLQKYAVITKESVSIEMPLLADDSKTVDSQGNEVKNYESTNASIVFDEPDYSSITATAGEDVESFRAIFVPYTDVNSTKISEYVARLNSGNGLILEMKPRSGELMWYSNSDMAQNYQISVESEATAGMQDLINELKEKEKVEHLAAQISCCVDNLLPTRTSAYTLKTELGYTYTDDNGTWLDPYNEEVRMYVVQLVQELFDMGFDEVVLADAYHPVLDEDTTLLYTNEISTTRSTVTAACGFAVSVAQELADREGLLSIYCETRTALAKVDTTTGQDARMFMKLYDRVYIRTDKSVYPYNVEDMGGSIEIGSVYDRLMPVVENYIPDNTSWILVDVDED